MQHTIEESELARIWRDATANNQHLMLITLYRRPLDYPEGFVLRPSYVLRGQIEPQVHSLAMYSPDADAPAAFVARYFPGCVWMHRSPDDDACVVGCWL